MLDLRTRARLCCLTLIVALTLVAPAGAYAAEPPDTARDFLIALNAGKADAAVALVAENATLEIFPAEVAPPGRWVGKEEIAGFLQFAVGVNAVLTPITTPQAAGEKVTMRVRETNDLLAQLKVDFIEHDDEYTIRDGKIVSLTLTVTAESLAKIGQATQPAMPGMPNTGAGGMDGSPGGIGWLPWFAAALLVGASGWRLRRAVGARNW